MAPHDAQNGTQPDPAAIAPEPGQDLDAAVDEFLDPPSAPASAAAGFDQGSVRPGAAEEPAPAHAAATLPAAGEGSPPAGSSPDDIWSTVDPAVRAAHEAALRDAQLRIEGIKGRQSAADREAQRLRNELAELRAKLAGGTPAQSQDEAPTQEVSADSLRQLAEEYPDVAGPLVDRLEILSNKLNTLEQPIGDLQQERIAAFVTEQTQKLDAKFPGYYQTITSDYERFQGWLQQQPRALQEAQARNADMIVDAEEAALVVGKYYADLGIGAPSAPTPAPAAPAAPADDRRSRQMAHGRDSGRSGPAVTTGAKDDLDAAIDVFLSLQG